MFARLLLISALAASVLAAQNITGAILGSVKDPSGAAVPRAGVTVTEKSTGVAKTVPADEAGSFQALYLKPGVYTVRASAAGFKTVVRDNVALQVDDQIRLDLVLEVGDVNTTVSVTGEVPLVETEKASLGQVVSERAVRDLPLQGRNVFDLVGLAAGVQTNPQGEGRVISSGSASGLAIFNAADISINGGRFRTNEFLLDGVSIMIPVQQQYALSPTPDGTQEFKVMSNSFGPQFGRSGGGVVNVVTKGGTDQLHGTVYEFFRNDRLRANNYFANANSQARGLYHFNMFGGTAGGAIVRNRTFFFADYQGQREGDFIGGRLLTIPTAQQHQGDYSGVRNASGAQVTIYDPLTTRPNGSGYVRTPFAGNILPASRMDPVAVKMAAYIPLPSRPGDGPAHVNNWAYAPKENTVSDQWSVRIDHRLSERHSLFARITRNTGYSTDSGEFRTIADTTNIKFTNDVYNGVLNGTYLFGPNSVLNYRYGLTRRVGNQITAGSGSVHLTDLGFPAAIPAKAQKEVFPQVTFTGYAPIGTPPDAPQANDLHTIVLEHTLIRGRHTIAYGTDLRLYNQNVFRPTGASGIYGFTAAFTQGPDPQRATLGAGDGFASFLTGYGTGNIQNTPAFAVRNIYAAGFVNDDIRFRRLTINLGLRWDYEQPRTERYDRFATFDFDRQFPLTIAGLPNLKGMLTHPGRDGYPRGNYDAYSREFGPRVGIAYRLGDRTVLRSGYGIFYLPRQGFPNAVQFGAAGFSITTDWVSSLDGVTPLNPLSNPFPNGLLLAPTSAADNLQIGQALTVVPRYNVNNAYVQHWNFSVQHEFRGNWLLEAAYAGNQGTHLPMDVQFNQVDPKYLSLGSGLSRQVPNPFFGLVPTGALANATVQQAQLLRPYPQYGNVDSNMNNTASSKYHSLQLRAEKRFSHGLNLLATYTAAKMIDNGSGRVVNFTPFQPPSQNQYDLRQERSLAEQDISQRLNISHTLELPFGKGRALLGGASGALDRLVGGWSVSGNAVFHTGFPLSLTSTGNSGVFSSALRPNSTGHSAQLSGAVESRLSRFFDISAFTVPAPFTFGNTARTLPDVRGPGRRNYNLALAKNTRLTERVGLVFRAEAFNLTNTPFFMPPGINLGASGFGVISQALGERQVQFTLKLVF